MSEIYPPAFIARLRRFMELRETRDESKKAAETAEKEYREAEADLYEELAADDSPIEGTLKLNLGDPWGVVSFGPRETYFGRIIKGMEDEALEHFEQRAMIDEVTEPKFSMKRINEIVRDVKEHGGKMPPGIDFYARRGVTITRPKT